MVCDDSAEVGIGVMYFFRGPYPIGHKKSPDDDRGFLNIPLV
jgi:hypothetical protein